MIVRKDRITCRSRALIYSGSGSESGSAGAVSVEAIYGKVQPGRAAPKPAVDGRVSEAACQAHLGIDDRWWRVIMDEVQLQGDNSDAA